MGRKDRYVLALSGSVLTVRMQIRWQVYFSTADIPPAAFLRPDESGTSAHHGSGHGDPAVLIKLTDGVGCADDVAAVWCDGGIALDVTASVDGWEVRVIGRVRAEGPWTDTGEDLPEVVGWQYEITGDLSDLAVTAYTRLPS